MYIVSFEKVKLEAAQLSVEVIFPQSWTSTDSGLQFDGLLDFESLKNETEKLENIVPSQKTLAERMTSCKFK